MGWAALFSAGQVVDVLMTMEALKHPNFLELNPFILFLGMDIRYMFVAKVLLAALIFPFCYCLDRWEQPYQKAVKIATGITWAAYFWNLLNIVWR